MKMRQQEVSEAPRARAAGLLLAVLAAACGLPEFTPPNVIERQRILAVRTEPREAAPGGTVALTGIAVNEDGTLYEGPYVFFITGSPDLNSGDSDALLMPDCGSIPGLPLPPCDQVVLPEGRAFEDRYGPYAPEGVVLTVAMIIGDIALDLETGLSLPEKPLIAIKSFIVKDEPLKRNPVFKEITILENGKEVSPNDDGAYPLKGGDHVKLVARVDFPTGDDGTFHWYTATEGIKKFDVKREASWGLPKVPGPYDLYCVVRENTASNFRDGDYEITSAGVDWMHVIAVIE